MSAAYNWFGAVAGDIPKAFGKDVAASDFDSSSGAGDGADEIAVALDRAEQVILGYLPSDWREMLDEIEGEVLEDYSFEDQTGYKTYFAVRSGNDENGRAYTAWPNVRIWRNWPHTHVNPNPNYNEAYEIGVDESGTSFSFDATRRIVTFSDIDVGEGDVFIISYEVDSTSASIPALKDCIVALASYELAGRLFSHDEPAYEEMRRRYEDMIDRLERIERGRYRLDYFSKIKLNKDRKVGRPTGSSGSVGVGRG